MISVWQCPSCLSWRHKRLDEEGWLTTPRCDRCGTRMRSVLRTGGPRSAPAVRNLAPADDVRVAAA